MRSFKLEICLDSVESALIAQNAGADRIELCAALNVGGITPSAGMLRRVRELLRIPLMVMIRPRGGDFCYSEQELEVMHAEIALAKEYGADGVVLGILTPEGSVDVPRTRELVELARPLSVTFHRALDLTRDPFAALEDVIQCGAERILTSGQAATALEGLPLITALVEKASGRISIMPGVGINAGNIRSFLQIQGISEVHMSASGSVDSPMTHRPEGVSFNSSEPPNEYLIARTDSAKIRQIKELKI